MNTNYNIYLVCKQVDSHFEWLGCVVVMGYDVLTPAREQLLAFGFFGLIFLVILLGINLSMIINNHTYCT